METLEAAEVIETLGLPHLQNLSTFGALSEEIIVDLLTNGDIYHLAKGEYIERFKPVVTDFQVVLQGEIAYYKCFEGHDVLTRHFRQGEQVGFDEMIGLIGQNGTDVATEDSLILNIGTEQFHRLHVKYPADFGLFMINLARELSREIELLEDVIGRGTGWTGETDN